jgi:hypothetical protein
MTAVALCLQQTFGLGSFETAYSFEVIYILSEVQHHVRHRWTLLEHSRFTA